MYKNYYTFCGLLVVLFLSAPLSWAQAVLRHIPKSPQIVAAQRAGLKNTYMHIVHTPRIPASRRIPLSHFTNSPEAIAARIERQLIFKQLNDKKRVEALAAKKALNIAKEQEEKRTAMNTPLGYPNTTSQTGNILFRGVKIGELNPNEYLFMAGAYNEQGIQVAALQTSTNSGQPITISNLEGGLLAYGIQRVLAAICVPQTANTPKQLRIIDYNVSTGTIKTITK